jgi:hypothetical protein
LSSVPRLLVASALFPAAALRAQNSSSEWDSLRTLKPGQEIRVVQTDMKSWYGRLALVTGESISLRFVKVPFRMQERTIPHSDVLRVGTQRASGRNTLIGLGVGAAFGAGIAAGMASRIDKGYGGAISKGGAAALSLTFCAGAGAGIGYAIPATRTVYRRARVR